MVRMLEPKFFCYILFSLQIHKSLKKNTFLTAKSFPLSLPAKLIQNKLLNVDIKAYILVAFVSGLEIKCYSVIPELIELFGMTFLLMSWQCQIFNENSIIFILKGINFLK